MTNHVFLVASNKYVSSSQSPHLTILHREFFSSVSLRPKIWVLHSISIFSSQLGILCIFTTFIFRFNFQFSFNSFIESAPSIFIAYIHFPPSSINLKPPYFL
ncbi:unnamed protein product [Cuscuta epithymum]|uniref:Uncharacterized protein n=1 Tax=Cuscuta epithymum TaxID=186058 RepID=A0AAV0CW27_9ASTE|nr:unnamed protein product [Cuscuta epithymum]